MKAKVTSDLYISSSMSTAKVNVPKLIMEGDFGRTRLTRRSGRQRVNSKEYVRETIAMNEVEF